MALLLLAAILATLFGAPAQAAPGVDTWVPPSPPAVRTPTPFFHDEVRHELILIDLGQYPALIYRLPDEGERRWSVTEINGYGPDRRRSDASWIFDEAGRQVIVFDNRQVDPPPCCDDTTGYRSYLVPLRVRLDGPARWETIATPMPRPLSMDSYMAAFDAARRRILVAGGRQRDLNPTMLSLELEGTPHWSVLEPPGDPLLRMDAGVLVDAPHDRMFVVGGVDTLDRASQIWTAPLSGGGPWTLFDDGSSLPTLPTYGYRSVAIDPEGERLFLYSRYSRPDDLPDTVGVWQLTLGASPTWSRMGVQGAMPPALVQAVLAFDAARDRLVLYGGYGNGSNGLDEERHDLVELDVDGTRKWTTLQACGSRPELGEGARILVDRAHHAGIALGQTDYRYGDSSLGAIRFDLGENQDWERGVLSSPRPPSRTHFSAVFDSIGDRSIVFGGSALGIELSDLWELTWQDHSPKWRRLLVDGDAPQARWGAATVLDPVRRRMILIGGYAGRPLEDVWALSLTSPMRWTRLDPRGVAPIARFGATAVYDERRDGVLLFGGNVGLPTDVTVTNESWFLSLADVAAWLPLDVPGPKPLARWLHAAIYDPVRDRMIVLWGRDRSGARFDCGSLELSGIPAWKGYTPDGPPAVVRWGHAAAYDPDRDQAIVVGGRVDNPYYGFQPLVDWYLEFAPSNGPPTGTGRPLALLGMTPNPTHAGVDVAFDIPHALPVRVRIYDARGRLVKSFDERTYPAGRHLIYWDGTGEDGFRPRPGVYFARLALGSSEFTGKVVLLR